jgi:hypothetical protein
MSSVPTTKPPPGFMRWANPYGPMPDEPRPRHFEFVEVWYPGVMAPKAIDPRNIHPATNVAYWYWRPLKSFGEEAH